MNLGPCKSITDAIDALLSVRSYKPFKYGGRWYVSTSLGIGVAYRSKKALAQRIMRENPKADCFQSATVDSRDPSEETEIEK